MAGNFKMKGTLIDSLLYIYGKLEEGEGEEEGQGQEEQQGQEGAEGEGEGEGEVRRTRGRKYGSIRLNRIVNGTSGRMSVLNHESNRKEHYKIRQRDARRWVMYNKRNDVCASIKMRQKEFKITYEGVDYSVSRKKMMIYKQGTKQVIGRMNIFNNDKYQFEFELYEEALLCSLFPSLLLFVMCFIQQKPSKEERKVTNGNDNAIVPKICATTSMVTMTTAI